MHHWGDDFKYWGEVSDAAQYIEDFLKRWGRIFVTQSKEKFGEVRVYCHFGGSSLHSFLFPGYHYKRPWFPQWLWVLDIYYLSKLFSIFTKFGFGRYQKFIYRLAYKRAIKKYPMIKEEILSCPDYSELLDDLWTKDDLRKQRDYWYKKFEEKEFRRWQLHKRWNALVESVRKGKSYKKQTGERSE